MHSEFVEREEEEEEEMEDREDDARAVCTAGAGRSEGDKKRRREDGEDSEEEREEGEEEDSHDGREPSKAKFQRRFPAEGEMGDDSGGASSWCFGEKDPDLSGEDETAPLPRFEGCDEHEEDVEENDELSVQQKESLRTNLKLREAFENNARLREAFSDVAASADQTATLAMYLNDAVFHGICNQVMDIIQGDEQRS